jgi:hypothetical protein
LYHGNVYQQAHPPHDMGGAVSEEKIPDMEVKDLDSLDNSGSET